MEHALHLHAVRMNFRKHAERFAGPCVLNDDVVPGMDAGERAKTVAAVEAAILDSEAALSAEARRAFDDEVERTAAENPALTVAEFQRIRVRLAERAGSAPPDLRRR